MPSFELALLRMGGLPLSFAEALSCPEVDKRLAEIASLDYELEHHRVSLERVLYAVVPALAPSDKDRRRQTLELARAVHGCRTPKISPSFVDDIEPLLSPDASRQLRAWTIASFKRHSLIEHLENDLGRATNRHARLALKHALSQPAFSDALLLNASVVFKQLLADDRQGDSSLSQAERAGIAYLLRASWKTSPLGTFMYLGQLTLGDQVNGPRTSRRAETLKTLTRLEPSYALELRRLAVHTFDARATVMLNPTVEYLSEHEIRFLKPSFLPSNGGVWRTDQYSDVHLGESLIKALKAIIPGATLEGLIAQFSIEIPNAHTTLASLLRFGVLVPSVFEGHPKSEKLKSRLRDLEATVTSTLPSGSIEQTRLVASWEHQALSARRELGITEGIAPLDRLKDDCGWFDGSHIGDGRLKGIASALEAVLSRYVCINPWYELLQDYFQRRFAGRICTNLMDFAWSAYPYCLSTQRPTTSLSLTASTTGEIVPVTAYVQLAEQADGSLRTYLNQAQSLTLSQTIKRLDECDSNFLNQRRQYSRWLQYLFNPAEPIEVPICSDCNSLQVHPSITQRVLRWGNEAVINKSTLDITSLSLSLDNNRFSLFDSLETPVALVYLGAVLPSPAWGPPYLFTLLSNPFVLKLPTTLSEERSASAGTVTFVPELIETDIVVRRACWIVKSTLLRSFCEKSALRTHYKIKAFRETHNIPRRCFIRPSLVGVPKKQPARKRPDKPMFVDFDSPVFQGFLQRVASNCEQVIITPAAPDVSEQWIRDDQEQVRVTELQLELGLTRRA